MDLPTSGAMISEFSPARLRGRLLSVQQLFWALGGLIAPLAGILFLPIGEESWRWMFASGALPALFILLGRRNIPETPRWLLSQGREQEAKRVLEWAGQSTDLRAAELPTGQLSGSENAPTSSRAAFAQLFSPQYRRTTILVSAVCFGASFGPMFISVYTAYLARFYGFTSDVQALIFGTIIQVFFLVGNVVNISFTDKIGRKPFLIGGATIVTVTLIAASRIGIEGNVTLVFGILTLAAVGHWGGANQAIWQYSAEVFPTRFRATGRGFTSSWIRMGAFLGALLQPTLFAVFGFGSTMLILAAVESTVIFLAFFLPEVKGQSLEEIESRHEQKGK